MTSVFHGRRMAQLPLLLCVVVAVSGVMSARAETRRAVLVAISDYEKLGGTAAQRGTSRGAWRDLEGPIHDLTAMREVLLSNYGFSPQNIVVLRNADATRDNILNAIRQNLIEAARPGDVSVFYYAGHGSQVRNSRTDEADGKDETIVPIDATRGAWDIRDKELSRLFNDAVDRDARVTVLFDSCHSGSICRGTPPGRARWLPGDPRDIAQVVGDEPPDDRGPPEKRTGGALILSAAQDHQFAYETEDSDGTPRGSFSLALLRALRADSGQPAADIFKRVSALMQASGVRQNPVMAGPSERLAQPLFGGQVDASASGTTVAVEDAADPKALVLNGGKAVGLEPDCELVKVGDDTIRIRIESLLGLNGASAKVIAGKKSRVEKGDLFRLDRWVAPDEPHLIVWAPQTGLSYDDVMGAAVRLHELSDKPGITWVEDPTRTRPTHEIAWDGKGWVLNAPGGKSKSLGDAPSAEDVLAHLKGGNIALMLTLPPTDALVEGLSFAREGGRPSSISKTSNRERAHYALMGRLQNGRLEYAWVMPSATQPGVSMETLPARSDWISIGANGRASARLAGQLSDYAFRLGVLRAWLTLEGPAEDVRFPYHLAVKDIVTGKRMKRGELTESGSYQLVLERESNTKRLAEKRFVYVFVIDSYGNSTLLFPEPGQGSVENTYPPSGAKGGARAAELPLGRPFQVGPPYGADTYVMLTSKEPIPNPDLVLDMQGVRTRAAEMDGLGGLLQSMGSKTRGKRRPTPVHWSIHRLTFNSRR